MSFNISDKVVCVDAVPGPGTLKGEFLYPNGFIKHGAVYVVFGTHMQITKQGNFPYLLIVGKPAIVAPGLKQAGEDVGFFNARFRKLSDIKAENAQRAEQDAAMKRDGFPSA